MIWNNLTLLLASWERRNNQDSADSTYRADRHRTEIVDRREITETVDTEESIDRTNSRYSRTITESIIGRIDNSDIIIEIIRITITQNPTTKLGFALNISTATAKEAYPAVMLTGNLNLESMEKPASKHESALNIPKPSAISPNNFVITPMVSMTSASTKKNQNPSKLKPPTTTINLKSPILQAKDITKNHTKISKMITKRPLPNPIKNTNQDLKIAVKKYKTPLIILLILALSTTKTVHMNLSLTVNWKKMIKKINITIVIIAIRTMLKRLIILHINNNRIILIRSLNPTNNQITCNTIPHLLILLYHITINQYRPCLILIRIITISPLIPMGRWINGRNNLWIIGNGTICSINSNHPSTHSSITPIVMAIITWIAVTMLFLEII